MKKLSLYVFLVLMFCNISFAENLRVIDGDTIVVGEKGRHFLNNTPNNSLDDSAYAGAVHVYRRSGSSWSKEATINASNAGYGDYLHGEAVALGLVAASRLSELSGLLPAGSTDRVANTLHRYDLPVTLKAPLPMDALLGAMRRDKKVRSGRLRFVLMEELGRAITVDEVSLAAVDESFTLIAANSLAGEVSN